MKKPKNFDANIIVIGAGSGGLISAYIAAAVKAKVILIEKHKMGGDCLNTGCVPSKALIKTARFLHEIKHSNRYGVKQADAGFDFSDVMDRVHSIVKKIEPHDSVERYRSLGVDCILGEARLIDPWSVQVGDQVLTAKNIIVATGASPFIPPIKGIEEVEVLTSENLWQLRELPQKMVVLGGGPMGSEMAQAFSRLGSEVTLVEMGPFLLSKEDQDVSEFIVTQFKDEGIRVMTSSMAMACTKKNQSQCLLCETQGNTIEIPFDQLLVAVGRKANVHGFGLEKFGITLRKNGTIDTDPFLRTSMPHIFAVGDVTGPFQFTHTASHQAWYAAVNSLFGALKKFKVDYSVVPWATFTDPEVARVGLNEKEAKAKGISYAVTTYGLKNSDRAIVDSHDRGWIKVLTPQGKDKILGVTIVGVHAGELMAEFVLAMKHGLGLKKILGTIHMYPTLAEANKAVAGNWQKNHKPEKTLKWLEKFHRWRRS